MLPVNVPGLWPRKQHTYTYTYIYMYSYTYFFFIYLCASIHFYVFAAFVFWRLALPWGAAAPRLFFGGPRPQIPLLGAAAPETPAAPQCSDGSFRRKLPILGAQGRGKVEMPNSPRRDGRSTCCISDRDTENISRAGVVRCF